MHLTHTEVQNYVDGKKEKGRKGGRVEKKGGRRYKEGGIWNKFIFNWCIISYFSIKNLQKVSLSNHKTLLWFLSYRADRIKMEITSHGFLWARSNFFQRMTPNDFHLPGRGIRSSSWNILVKVTHVIVADTRSLMYDFPKSVVWTINQELDLVTLALSCKFMILWPQQESRETEEGTDLASTPVLFGSKPGSTKVSNQFKLLTF